MVKICGSVDEAVGNTDSKTEKDFLIKDTLDKIKHKFIVMSGKGGVGKTSVAVNLAITLSEQNYNVGLIDIDLHGPDVPRMLGLNGRLNIGSDDKLRPVECFKNLKVISVESLMPSKDEAIIWRGPMKYSVIQQFIANVGWGDLDFLLIDAPPGTGDEPLTIAQSISDAKSIIVTTPQEISLADVRKSINFCKTVKMEIFGLIENMSGFICPNCESCIDLFGIGGGKKTAEVMDVPFLGSIPFDQNMVLCSDSGVSYQKKFFDTKVTNVFKDIAKSMIGLLE